MAEADVEGEKALREWAAAQKVTSKTVDLLIKDGFNSMEAVEMLDCDDLLQSKIPRGQQKLLLKTLQKGPYSPNNSATAHGNEAGPSGEGSGGRGESSDGRGESSGGRGEGVRRERRVIWRRDLGTASDDVYAQLMTEHLRSLQADDGRRNAQAPAGWPICKMFNTYRSCGYTDCKFVYACSHKGCSQNHPAISHFQHQTSDHPR